MNNNGETKALKTGYSIYSALQKRLRKTQPLPDLYPPLPNKKYSIIYADPPWDYGGKMQFDRSSKSADKIDLSRNIFISSAEFKYPTLRLDQLAQIPVNTICNNDCLLFLWATGPHLNHAIRLGEAWGFEYRTVAFVWDKMIHNPGRYTLSNCEFCLLFKRGRIPLPRGARNIQQLIRVPRKQHSEKPDEVREAIFKMWPAQDKIELFSRKKCQGWDSWGLDAMENPDDFKLKME